ncbi:uncharacterized mitochondrial protein-like protein [Tanacetum coccineum]
MLNTIDHLGKFDGKANEGFFVGYSINSKAFRVFNSRTRIVEENLHVQFSENTPNIAGSGPNWLFDIDYNTPCFQLIDDFSRMRVQTLSDDEKKVDEDPRKDCESIDQEKDASVNSTNNVNAASTNKVNAVGRKASIELPDDPNMPALEDIVYSDDDEDVGAEADMNNLDTTIQLLCTKFKKMMHKKFQISSMGELIFFLVLQVKQMEDGIFINQDKYVTDILKKFGFIDVKTASNYENYNKPFCSEMMVEK